LVSLLLLRPEPRALTVTEVASVIVGFCLSGSAGELGDQIAERVRLELARRPPEAALELLAAAVERLAADVEPAAARRLYEAM
jgi:hypothetical protein